MPTPATIEPAKSSGCGLFSLVWLALLGGFGFGLHGLVPPAGVVGLALLGATFGAAGLRLLLVGPGLIRRQLGLVFLLLHLVALLPFQSAERLARLPFGSTVLAARDGLLRKAVAAEDWKQARRLASLGLGDPTPRDSFDDPLIEDVDDPDTLAALLQGGLDPDLRDENRRTLLMNNRQPAIARVLLAAGADPDAQDERGHTALVYAASYHVPELVDVLVAGGASLDVRDAAGQTVAASFPPGHPARPLLEAHLGAPLPATAETPDVRADGRNDWLVAENQPGSLPHPSITGPDPPLFHGQVVPLEITVSNPTAESRLVQVTASLGRAAYFAEASHGAVVVLPDETPLEREIRWPALGLPPHSAGRLQLETVARWDSDAGDFVVDVSVLDAPTLDQLEALVFHRPLSHDPADAQSSTSVWWSLVLIGLPIFCLLVFALAHFGLAPDHPFRRATGRLAAVAGAGLLGYLTFSLVWLDLRTYLDFSATSCTILDRRASLEISSHRTSTTRGRRDPDLDRSHRPMVAVTYQARGGAIVTSGSAGLRSMSDLDALAIGDELPCWIDPHHPERFVLRRGIDATWLALLTGSLSLALLGGVAWSLRSNRRSRS